MNNEAKLMAIHPACVPAAQAMLGAVNMPDDDEEKKGFEYYAENGTAIISINGVLGHKLTAAQKAMGGVDTIDVIEAVENAAADSDVQTILLDVDSPGGTVGGIPELAETIEDVQRGGQNKSLLTPIR